MCTLLHSSTYPMFNYHMMCAIHFLESPPNPPTITAVMCSDTTCTVKWTPSDFAQSYTATWINLNNTSEMYSDTVPGNKYSYSISGLSVNVVYTVSVTAVDLCGRTIESDNYIFNSECGCG